MTDGWEWLTLAAGGGVLLGRLVFAFRRHDASPEPEPETETCAGYVLQIGTPYNDCKAHRSTRCLDGRCRYHCDRMCKCEQLYAPPNPNPYR